MRNCRILTVFGVATALSTSKAGLGSDINFPGIVCSSLSKTSLL
jgi:hypothetical protein